LLPINTQMRSGCRLWVLGLVTVGWTALLFYAYVLDISWRPLQHGLIGFGSQERHPHHHCHICCGGGEAKVHHDVHDLLHHRQLPPVPVVVGVMSNGRKQERRSLWRQALLPILERYSGLKPGVDYVLKFIIGEIGRDQLSHRPLFSSLIITTSSLLSLIAPLSNTPS